MYEFFFGPRHQIEAAALALSGSDWSVAQSDDACDLITTNSLLEADAASVADKAGREIARLNTVYELFNPSDRASLTLGQLSFIIDDGSLRHFLSTAIRSPLETGLTISHVLSEGKEVPVVLWSPAVFVEAPYSAAYQKLSRDPDLEGVVRAFLAHPSDWTRIAKVLELIQHRCEGQILKTWVSGKQLKRLDRMANSFAEAGGTGRHARPNYKAPPKAMAITEAEQIARKVLSNWLGAS